VSKKEILKFSPQGTDESVFLYTLVSAESDLKIISILNQIFDIRLILSDDLIYSIKSTELHFKKYLFETEDGSEKFVFLKNKYLNHYLLPEYKVSLLRSNACISAVFSLKPDKVKSFNRIRF
jgi:hypothetical protein